MDSLLGPPLGGPITVINQNKIKQLRLKYVWLIPASELTYDAFQKTFSLLHPAGKVHTILLICFFSIIFCFQRLIFNLKIIYLSVKVEETLVWSSFNRTDYNKSTIVPSSTSSFSWRILWFIISIATYLYPCMKWVLRD